MTTLAANLSADNDEMRVDAAVAEPAPYYQIDDEIIQVLQNSTTVNDPFYSPRRSVDATLWPIERAVSGTTAATHNSGATLTAVYDPSVGGGTSALTLDNTVDAPAEIITLVVPGATIIGDEGTIANLRATATGDGAAISTHETTTVDGEATVAATAAATGDGPAVLNLSASAQGAGDVYALLNVNAAEAGAAAMDVGVGSGSGDATLNLSAGSGVELLLMVLSVVGGTKSLVITGLPSVDPEVAGAVWNSSGTLMISDGP